MKSVLFTAMMLLCMSELSSGPITIYGRAYIKGNRVDCYGGSKLCAVIPRKETDDPPSTDNVITIFGENGQVIEEHTFSSISIVENPDGTSVTWIP